MTTSGAETFIESSHRPTSIRRTVDGVTFTSYSTPNGYVRISDDGQIKIVLDGVGYAAEVMGHGWIKAPSGNPKRFLSDQAACREAIQLRDRLQNP
jgi:hypothetical protein